MSNGTASGKDLAQIAAAVTAVVGVLTGLAVTGVLERAQRDHGVWLLAAFSCVLAGATLWLGATIWSGLAEKVSQVLAICAFGVGLGLAIVAVLKTQQEAERPAVSADFNPRTGALTASVSADGLTPEQRIVIRVDGLTYPEDAPVDATNLYFGVLGANPDGVVREPVHVIVPAGEFDAIGVKAWTGSKDEECSYRQEVSSIENASGKTSNQKRRPGCIILTVPGPPTGPELTAQWGPGRILILHLAARDQLGRVSLRAVGLTKVSRTHLVTWVGNPDSTGVLNVTLRVPVRGTVRRICVQARLDGAASQPRCPLRGHPMGATQIQLSTPMILSGDR